MKPKRIAQTRQPTGMTRVRPELRQGLLFCYNGALDAVVDGDRRGRLAALPRTVTGSGVGIQCSGTTGIATILDTTAGFASSQVTILVVGQRRDASGINELLSKNTSGGTGFEIALSNQFGSPTTRIYSSHRNTAGASVNFATGFVDGIADGLNGTFNTVTSRVYAIAAATTVMTQDASPTDIRMGSIGGGFSANVDVLLAAVWVGRTFPAEQLRAWSINPNLIYEESTRHLGAPVPSGSASYFLTTTPGSFTITGSSANLITGRLLATTPGSFTITGFGAGVNAGRLLEVTPGSFTITGFSANLVYTTASSFLLETTPGSFTLTGASANLLYNSILSTTPGSYTLSFASANLFVESPNKLLETTPGQFFLSFASAGLQYSGDAQTLRPGGRGLSPWQMRQNRLQALKNELWYLYQDENDEELKEAILDVVRDDTNIDELLGLLRQQLTLVKSLYNKAQQEQYQKAYESAQEIKKAKVKQRNEDAAVMLLF